MPSAKTPRNSSAAGQMLGRWDLGKKRSLDQLIDFTGVDTRNYRILHGNCGKLKVGRCKSNTLNPPSDENHLVMLKSSGARTW
jgi:hypothetical protein